MQRFHIGDNIEKSKSRLIELIKEGSKELKRNDIRFIYKNPNNQLVLEALIELEKRGIDVIRRQWRHPDFLHFSEDLKGVSGYARRETGFKMKDFYTNVEKLLKLVPDYYSTIIKKLSPKAFYMLKNNKYYRFKYEDNNPSLGFMCFISDSDSFKTSISEDFEKDKTTISTVYGSFFGAIRINKPILYTQLSGLVEKRIREELNLNWNYQSGIIF